MDIQTTIERYLGHPEDVKGDDHAYYCPKCNWKNPRLMVNYDKNSFHCWYCKWGGQSLIPILYEVGADRDIIKELKIDLGEYNGKDENGRSVKNIKFELKNKLLNSANEVVPFDNLKLPDEYYPIYDRRGSFLYARIINHLRSKRKLSWETIRNFDLRYNPEQGKLLIPSYNSEGKLNYYITRADNGFYSTIKGRPKYHHIFFESHINFLDTVIIAEGVFDALKIGYNTIPLLGKIISNTLIDKLIKYPNTEVVLYLDSDAYLEAIPQVKKMIRKGVRNVSIVKGIDGLDPDETSRDDIQRLIENRKKINLKNLLELNRELL